MDDRSLVRLSIALPQVAETLNNVLTELAGEEVSWVLLVQTNKVAQYVSNTSREGGSDLIRSLLNRWESGKADIPAHYNPDLKDDPDLTFRSGGMTT